MNTSLQPKFVKGSNQTARTWMIVKISVSRVVKLCSSLLIRRGHLPDDCNWILSANPVATDKVRRIYEVNPPARAISQVIVAHIFLISLFFYLLFIIYSIH